MFKQPHYCHFNVFEIGHDQHMQCNLSERNIDVIQLQKSLYSKTKLGSIANPDFQMNLWQELLSLAGCSSAAHLLATSVFIRVTGLIRLFERG